jgi:hypothetical protein
MKSSFTLCLLLVLTSYSFAQKNGYYSNSGAAIGGYDPVAYFMKHEAMLGSDHFTTEWSGSKWKFINQANLNLFKAAPTKYAPQYGGYCAYGCSENHKAPTDPTAWTIINDKLYLNYNAQVKTMWISDTTNRIKAANAYWSSLNN